MNKKLSHPSGITLGMRGSRSRRSCWQVDGGAWWWLAVWLIMTPHGSCWASPSPPSKTGLNSGTGTSTETLVRHGSVWFTSRRSVWTCVCVLWQSIVKVWIGPSCNNEWWDFIFFASIYLIIVNWTTTLFSGITGKDFLNVAAPREETCQDCPEGADGEGSCRNNILEIIVTQGKLTSGYIKDVWVDGSKVGKPRGIGMLSGCGSWCLVSFTFLTFFEGWDRRAG